MADLELLKQLRDAGVKAVDFHFDGQTKATHIIAVEFFPRDLLDVGSMFPPEVADPEAVPTDRPPAPAGEEMPTRRVPPALAALLKTGSVS